MWRGRELRPGSLKIPLCLEVHDHNSNNSTYPLLSALHVPDATLSALSGWSYLTWTLKVLSNIYPPLLKACISLLILIDSTKIYSRIAIGLWHTIFTSFSMLKKKKKDKLWSCVVENEYFLESRWSLSAWGFTCPSNDHEHDSSDHEATLSVFTRSKLFTWY